jgi:hypothetical protein
MQTRPAKPGVGFPVSSRTAEPMRTPPNRAPGTDTVSLLISMRVGGGWAAGVLTFAWLTKAGMHARGLK